MQMLPSLFVTVHDRYHNGKRINRFYTLYADGEYSDKYYDDLARASILTYPAAAVIALFYTYPVYREAVLVRNSADGNMVLLPGLSHPVSKLFAVSASRRDKFRRALYFLRSNCKKSGGAFHRSDDFYLRLFFLLSQKGPLNYASLSQLAGQFPG